LLIRRESARNDIRSVDGFVLITGQAGTSRIR